MSERRSGRVPGRIVVYRHVHPARPAPDARTDTGADTAAGFVGPGDVVDGDVIDADDADVIDAKVIDAEVIDAEVIDAEVIDERADQSSADTGSRSTGPGALVPVSRSSAVALRRAGAVVRRSTVRAVLTAYVTARLVATHERTRTAARWLVRNAVLYPATGVVVACQRVWEARTTARYERMMRAAEAAGDLDRLAEWEQRAEFVRERRHRRVMQWIYAPFALVKALMVAAATLAGVLLALGVTLAVANRDVSWVLAPIGAIVELVAFVVWVLTVVWLPLVLAAPWIALAILWNLGRTQGRLPAWAVPERVRGQESVVITPGGIAAALAHLGISDLNKAIKAGWQVEFLTPPMLVNNRGYFTVFSLPLGITPAMIADRRDVLARNLFREPLEVWPTAAEDLPWHVALWVAHPGSTKRPAPPYPLLDEGTTDVFAGVPFGMSQRGEVIAPELPGANIVFGGVMGQGKSNAARVMMAGAALDPLVELWVFVFANNGDFDAYRPRLARYHRSADDDTVLAALAALRELYADVGRREALLAEVGAKKVTRSLAAQHPGLRPLVVLFSECHELFGHEEYGREAADLAVQTMRRARKTAITLAFDTQSARKEAIPPKIVELVKLNVCFAVKSWRSNDGFLGDGSFNAGIRATELRMGKDVGTSVLTGATGERFEVVKWFYLDADDDTGYDAATDIIARAMENLHPGVHRDAGDATGTDEEERDLLADVADVLGQEKVNAADVPPRLRKLAPGYPPYRSLSGVQLRKLLAEHGVTVPSTGNRYPVDPAAIRARLAERPADPDRGQP